MAIDSDEQFLVRVGLSLLTARTYYDNGHPEHSRLALIVLDGAAEILLRRLVASQEMSFRAGQIMFKLNEEAAALGAEPPHIVHAMTFPSDVVCDDSPCPVYLSGKQQERLDREFGPMADVAVFFGDLNRDEGRALRHLHDYRNGAHHRNVVNLQTVRVLVELQLTVLAALLESMSPGSIHGFSGRTDWGEAREVLGLPEDSPVSYIAFADRLREGIAPSADDIIASFGRNLSERVAQVVRRVAEIRSQMRIPGITFKMWLGLVQEREPWSVVEGLHSLEPSVTIDKLESWALEVVSVGPSETALQAFARLVEIDFELTKLEDAIERVEMDIDEEVQRMIDERLGK